MAQGRPGEAATRLKEALDTGRRVRVGVPLASRVARSLASVLATMGRYQEATDLLEDADREIIQAFGDRHPVRTGILWARSVVSMKAGDPRGQLEAARRGCEVSERAGTHSASDLYILACDALVKLEQYSEAMADCDRAVAFARSESSRGGYQLVIADTVSGDALLGLGRYDDAAARFEEAIAINERRGAPPEVFELTGLGIARLAQGKPREALPLLEKALMVAAHLEESSADLDHCRGRTQASLARALWATGVRSPRVAELVQASADSFRRAHDEGRAREIEAWLEARHGSSPAVRR
jgi:tetratricopeptide (TPR) repeat protein